MIYVIWNKAGDVAAVTDNFEDARLAEIQAETDTAAECRCDWHSLERAADVAAQVTEHTGELYIGVDKGAGTWPRFDVVRAPAAGCSPGRRRWARRRDFSRNLLWPG